MQMADSPARKGEANKQEKILCLRTNAHFNNGHKFYKFENILDGTCDQVATFHQCNIAQMARCFVRQGKNCNVLVYGPTNSGKTYTMIGDCPSLQLAKQTHSRSPTSIKGHSACTDRRQRSKSNPRLRPVSVLAGGLEKQPNSRRKAQSRLNRTRSQRDNRGDFDAASNSSNCQNASPEAVLKPHTETSAGGIIPRALK